MKSVQLKSEDCANEDNNDTGNNDCGTYFAGYISGYIITICNYNSLFQNFVLQLCNFVESYNQKICVK